MAKRVEEIVAAAVFAGERIAPSKLKARIYSAMMLAESADGPLRSLTDTKEAGRGLCVFERLAQIAPVSDQFNYCRVCHARVLGERVEDPPLYWSCCPYAGFKPE